MIQIPIGTNFVVLYCLLQVSILQKPTRTCRKKLFSKIVLNWAQPFLPDLFFTVLYFNVFSACLRRWVYPPGFFSVYEHRPVLALRMLQSPFFLYFWSLLFQWDSLHQVITISIHPFELCNPGKQLGPFHVPKKKINGLDCQSVFFRSRQFARFWAQRIQTMKSENTNFLTNQIVSYRSKKNIFQKNSDSQFRKQLLDPGSKIQLGN